MFEFEPGLIFWNTVSFSILVFLMYKWVLPPLIAVLKEREKSIAWALDKAAQSQKQSEEIFSSARQKLSEANQTAQRIVDQARLEGEKLKNEIVAAARKEAELTGARVKEDLRRQKAEILSELQTQTVDLVAAAASRILRKQIDKSENKRL